MILAPGNWASVGVWQIREGVWHACENESAIAETFHGAIREVAPGHRCRCQHSGGIPSWSRVSSPS